MKTLQKDNLVGSMVISKQGRDKDNCYIVIEQLDNDFVSICNGNTKKQKMPKRKNLKHLVITEITNTELTRSILLKEINLDLKIKRFLKLKGIGKEV